MSGKNKQRFGLLGKAIDYSFSRTYFQEKFKQENLDYCSYENFDLPHLNDFTQLLEQKSIKGMNVTIPYKQEVIPFLDRLDPVAKEIGAVNTIVFDDNGSTTGHNTDYIGFKKSIEPLCGQSVKKALVLGTGGASKAVVYCLEKMGIQTQYVSRQSSENALSYDMLSPQHYEDHKLIVNCTPLGTFPDVNKKPPIDYNKIGRAHILFDLIYNPEMTAFMKAGKEQGAVVANGASMLVGQAEASWKLWTS
jgi:shikimate dehydrogenase